MQLATVFACIVALAPGLALAAPAPFDPQPLENQYQMCYSAYVPKKRGVYTEADVLEILKRCM
ncbi:hypothetical protein B0T14DRAFT_604114 [Immersiella caudata]|uniref:Uncharacterized protein n=1 Tax=Immersiella caudata TaxID=314043 RepID=A0AA40C081_9PEZI|nr:hypothetical protein B0T14DRAFT_604114 [Immersiella caudata]